MMHPFEKELRETTLAEDSIELVLLVSTARRTKKLVELGAPANIVETEIIMLKKRFNHLLESFK